MTPEMYTWWPETREQTIFEMIYRRIIEENWTLREQHALAVTFDGWFLFLYGDAEAPPVQGRDYFVR